MLHTKNPSICQDRLGTNAQNSLRTETFLQMMIPGMAPGSVLVGPAAAAAMWITDSNVWVSAASGFPLVRSGGDFLPFISRAFFRSSVFHFWIFLLAAGQAHGYRGDGRRE